MLSRLRAFGALLFLATAASSAFATPRTASIRWGAGDASGEIEVLRGKLVSLTAPSGQITQPATFQAASRLDVAIEPDANALLPVLVTVHNSRRTFTFNLGEVDARFPIYLPGDRVIVTTVDEARSFDTIVADLGRRRTRTALQKIEAAPEATLDEAYKRERENKVMTLLGVSRDDRIFRVDSHLEWLEPRLSGRELRLPEAANEQVTYEFEFGRGWGVRENIRRKLANSDLPILEARIVDDDIRYDVMMLVALERQPLTAANIRGTPYLLADLNSHGHMFTPAQNVELEKVKQAEEFPPEETVLYARVMATNIGATPRYAFFRLPTPTIPILSGKKPPEWSFDGAEGFGVYKSGRVFLTAQLDGKPLPSSEVSPLLMPGESATFDFAVPHRPVTRERAAALAAQSFDTKRDEALEFWRGKLASAAQWTLPDPRIDAMVRAGLLHLDLVAYGREPDGPVLPAIGIYTAIGSESAPIIQFMDTMGWHDTAARAIDFFLAKQHDDGFMQNFNGYMLETGAVLWTMGEHYRYTHDDAWLRRVHAKLTLACEYLSAWRKRNLQPELKGNGYGMLDGKTADPDDPFRSFMLNGYAYLGLSRAAEMLATLAPDEAAKWRAEADTLKADIRASLAGAFERGPVVPLGDGTWSRAAAPWSLYRGPVMLHADGGKWFTHGSMTSRDSLLGPLYLVFQEIVDPREPMGEELLNVHSELMTKDNVAFSQPYYSRHPWVHLQRSEPKAFLQAWTSTVAAMADRETYTFTEHLFPVSAHKTHEEAWFLMETRWMLYLEHEHTLRLLAGVPRDYLRPPIDRTKPAVAVKNASTYFGPLSFEVRVPDAQTISATIECAGDRRPSTIELRVPHPSGRPAVSVEGGEYQAATETVRIANFSGHAEVKLRWD